MPEHLDPTTPTATPDLLRLTPGLCNCKRYGGTETAHLVGCGVYWTAADARHLEALRPLEGDALPTPGQLRAALEAAASLDREHYADASASLGDLVDGLELRALDLARRHLATAAEYLDGLATATGSDELARFVADCRALAD